jgi:hypothetical protein
VSSLTPEKNTPRAFIAVRLFTQLKGWALINKYRDGGVGIRVCMVLSMFSMMPKRQQDEGALWNAE